MTSSDAEASSSSSSVAAVGGAHSVPPPLTSEASCPSPTSPPAASFAASASASAAAKDNAASASASASAPIEVESSPQDDRAYLSHTLPNDLRCLLISDPTSDKAAAALDVRVGHFSDPDELPGLAHFCEHMLFLGTEKYPDENEYNQYLQRHGGRSNAFTDMESTNYYFDVSADHLDGALDRFAQFFISPLFTSAATNREMNAVDSEHSKNLQSDHWRSFQLYKSLASENHPFHKFGSGNLKTLKEDPESKGVDTREALLDFHGKYYSSNVMRLCVLGTQPVEELRDMVEGLFNDVKDKGIDPPAFPGTPYPPSSLGRRLSVVPVREKRELELTFPLREVQTLYRKKPLKYISHLLGHEGVGSVLAFLRERGWANELSAGESRGCNDWSAFSVSIELTDDGLAEVDNVASVVFAYLNMLRAEGPQRWIHDEESTVADTHFRFLSKREPMDYVCSLAGAMQLYPSAHSVSGPYKMWEYDPAVITECLEYMRPDNVIMGVSAKMYEGKTSLKEEWYGVEYNAEDVAPALLKKWEDVTVDDPNLKIEDKAKLSFPEKNDMIATDFDLRSHPPSFPLDEPRLLDDISTLRLWYKPDNIFSMPKINVMAVLKSSLAYDSPENAVLALLYVDILREHTTSFSYLATMAGLHCSFVNARKGLELHVSGYNHKCDKLVQRIVDAMLELPAKLDDEVFARIKDKTMKQYQNFMVGAVPYQHAFYGADLILEEGKWSVPDKMGALDGLSAQDVREWSGRFLRRFKLEMLIHGNASPAEAKRIADTVLDGLKPSAPFQAHFPQRHTYIHSFDEYNPSDPNSCLENIYQIGRVSLRDNAKLAFLNHLLQEPAFNELRTQEQLGYIVHCSIKTSGDDVKGLLILIMSDSYHPSYLDDRVEAFLDRFRSKLVRQSVDEFNSNVDAVVTNFFEKNKNLGEESSKYWSGINDEKYVFRKYKLIGEEVQSLTREDVLRFYDRYVAQGGRGRSKLSVRVVSKAHKEKMESDGEGKGKDDNEEESATTTIIGEDDVVNFQRSMPLHSLPDGVDVEGMRMKSDDDDDADDAVEGKNSTP
uniref:Insulin-degrading enzyme n=2 Tax=Odontella aurita TaxID=265563 RepID=A0A7S4JUU6_9STRA|mmetsp:Transcript_54773/g.163883  ORF Transcript_54773/g.163883 Transcript_54773/m.163883 type:complete len:1060 (+) Transcript_54773:343-3522(+)